MRGDAGIGEFGYKKNFYINKTSKKNVLIAGAGSYIGENLKAYAAEHYPNIHMDTVDMKNSLWKEKNFSMYDAVFHAAGIAHADIERISDEEKKNYYRVNTDLAIDTAIKCKESGIGQFILMSSMIIYGESVSYGTQKVIDEYTLPNPSTFYGDSKWQADKGVRALEDEAFRVAVLRPPMIYGRGSKGNYPVLSRLAKRLPIFPDIKNQRSMLYIDNLCEFVCLLILSGEGGIYFPQNEEYSNTSSLVREISSINGKRIKITKLLNPLVMLGSMIPGKVSKLVNKAFGNSVYKQKLSVYDGLDYRICSLKNSIQKTEGKGSKEHSSVLIVASVASMIDQFNISNIKLLLGLGCDVDVAANFAHGSTCTGEKIHELIQLLDALSVDCYQIDFDRKVVGLKGNIKTFGQLGLVMKGKARPVNQIRHHKICEENGYSFIHAHSPVGGVVGRIAAKRNHVKTIYTAHGFHFYKGASKKNWLLYYPVEKWLSRITDVLITINREDYKLAKRRLNAKQTVYVPGIGIDVKKFADVKSDREAKRKSLGIDNDEIMLLSVGELNENKNHNVVIEALGQLKKRDSDIGRHVHYFIAGKGSLAQKLAKQAECAGVKLHLLGFRNDVPELLKAADLFVLPSFREGLNVGLMEAIASGVPCIASDIRGNRDLIASGRLFLPNDPQGLCLLIQNMCKEKKNNKKIINMQKFGIDNVNRRMLRIYNGVLYK